MIPIRININGKDEKFQVHPGETLLKFLRRQGYTGVKNGCSSGDCGACTVILNGRAVNSCLLFAVQADQGTLTTIEGIGTPDHPHPLQKNFVGKGGVQCGFCVPGMILSGVALLEKNPSPDREEIKDALNGNLCRCTSYIKQIEAVESAAKDLKKSNGGRRKK